MAGKYAIEVRSSSTISSKDLAGLIALSEEKIIEKFFLIYTGEFEQWLGQNKVVHVVPYRKFLLEVLPKLK